MLKGFFLLGERLKGGGPKQVKLTSISLPFERQHYTGQSNVSLGTDTNNTRKYDNIMESMNVPL